MELLLLRFAAAISAAAGAVAGAGTAAGAADTFDAFLLCSDDVQHCQAKNQEHHDNKDNIFHNLFLSAECVFRLQLLVRIEAQVNHDGSHDGHRNQSAHKAGTHSAGGDQGADLVHQEADNKAGTQL